jgi:hypothetical protein
MNKRNDIWRKGRLLHRRSEATTKGLTGHAKDGRTHSVFA